MFTARSGMEPLSAAEKILIPLLAPGGNLQSRSNRAQSSAISRGFHRAAGSSHVLIEPVTVQVLLRKKERGGKESGGRWGSRDLEGGKGSGG